MNWSHSGTFTLDSQDSAFCPLLPGQDAGQGSGWATKRTIQGWNRRARESPGQVMEADRTQLSEDQGGGTLAIDTLPDNGTRVVVSDVGAWMGREVLGRGAQVPHVCTYHLPLGLARRSVWRERSGGDGSRPQPGSSNLGIPELHRLPISSWTQRGKVICSKMHSMSIRFLTLNSFTA